MDKKDWQPRQIMHKADYEIFYYYNKGQKEVPLHRHDFYEIMAILSGSATFWVEDTPIPVAGGDIIIIPPHKSHNMTISSAMPYERIILWISTAHLHSLSTENTDLSNAFTIAEEHYKNLLQLPSGEFQNALDILATIGRFSESSAYADDILAKIALMQFLLKINKMSVSEEKQSTTFIQSVLEYINSTLTEELSLNKLSEKFFLSQSRISHLFKAEMGISVHKYIIKKRLQRSKELIEKGYPINKVCFMSGFKDYIGFFKHFKAEFNTTPKQYYAEYLRNK